MRKSRFYTRSFAVLLALIMALAVPAFANITDQGEQVTATTASPPEISPPIVAPTGKWIATTANVAIPIVQTIADKPAEVNVVILPTMAVNFTVQAALDIGIMNTGAVFDDHHSWALAVTTRGAPNDETDDFITKFNANTAMVNVVILPNQATTTYTVPFDYGAQVAVSKQGTTDNATYNGANVAIHAAGDDVLTAYGGNFDQT